MRLRHKIVGIYLQIDATDFAEIYEENDGLKNKELYNIMYS